MLLTKNYLIMRGFVPDDYSNALKKVLYEGFENGTYTYRTIMAYVDGVDMGEKIDVELSTDDAFLRIRTNSVERVNQMLSFLHLKERI